MTDTLVYLDHAATTPLDPLVLQAMTPYLTTEYGNASTLYSMGRLAEDAVENARDQVAALLGANRDEIVFTSGATEADNEAVFGAATAREARGKHLIVSAIEHEAVLRPCERLETRGWEVTRLPVNSEGRVDPDHVKSALRPDTVLVSVMHSNNETGVIQPIEEIGALTRDRGVLFHTDAVQSVGKVPLDVEALQCDLLSLSGHKIYGPKGAGALWIRKGVKIQPFMEGGGQERGRRSGTYNVPGIVGLGAALELAESRLVSDASQWRLWRDRILKAAHAIPDTRVNGSVIHRLPHNANVSFLGVEGEVMLLNLDDRGFCVSSGAACSSGSMEPSHVLTAMGVPRDWAQGSLRVTVGRANSEDQMDRFLEALLAVVSELRGLSALG